jgi:hypothetical protein
MIVSDGLDKKWPVLPVSAIREVMRVEDGREADLGGESKVVWVNRDLGVKATRGRDSRVRQLILFGVGTEGGRLGLT